jgi:hypothetical protein
MTTTTKPNGPAVATVLAASAGVFTIGFLNAAGELVGTVRNILTWNSTLGPSSGKAGMGIIVWLVLWAMLAARHRGQNADGRLLMLSWVLIVAGFVLTVPAVTAAIGSLR